MNRPRMDRPTGACMCTAIFLLLTAFEVQQGVAVNVVAEDTVAKRGSTAKTGGATRPPSVPGGESA